MEAVRILISKVFGALIGILCQGRASAHSSLETRSFREQCLTHTTTRWCGGVVKLQIKVFPKRSSILVTRCIEGVKELLETIKMKCIGIVVLQTEASSRQS